MDVVCYDAETTGSDKTCCQILQFGAVRLNESYVETEAVEVQVRLLPYVVPAVGALAVTKIDVATLDDPDRKDEFDAAREIDDILRPRYKARRLHLTFNGISYDDEVIRRTLFRNMRNPFFHNVTRVDLLPLCQAIRLSGDEGLKFMPPDENGKVRTRLGDMCTANGIDLDGAHDAIADTRATVALAERIRTQVPWAWDLAFACGSASEVSRHLSHKGATWILDTFAKDIHSAATPYALVGTVDEGRYALLADPVHFYGKPLPKELPHPSGMLFRERDQPELPFKIVALNKSILILRPEDVSRFVSAEDIHEMDDAAQQFLSRKSDVRRLHDHVRSLEKKLHRPMSGPSSEERIYETFLSPADKDLCKEFLRAGSWNARVHIDFKDARASDFAARIILRNLTFDEVARLSNNDRAALFEERAAEAFGRPFATPGADRDKGWATIAGCLEDERCTSAYASWLANNRHPPQGPQATEEDEDEVEYAAGPGGP